MKIDPLVLQPHQARTREPSAYENQLGDAMEQAFASGAWELEDLVSQLNQTGPTAPNGQSWTAESFSAEIKRLSLA
ncbi:MAG: recombinase-like helix-turn-helix domain-containing protein [Brachymonas sp.]